MRDHRFVAGHRGGPLDLGRHRLLAAWAADCAEHVLQAIESESRDARLADAIAAARAWVRGEVSVGAARKAALAAHAVARDAGTKAAVAAARAAGHAVATAHMADHALRAAAYAQKSITAAGGDVAAERAWQAARLPADVRALVAGDEPSRIGGGVRPMP